MTKTIRFKSMDDLEKYWSGLGYERYFKDWESFLLRKSIPVDKNDKDVRDNVRISIKKYLTTVTAEIRFPQIKLRKNVIDKVVSTDYEITENGLLPAYTNVNEKTIISHCGDIILLPSLK